MGMPSYHAQASFFAAAFICGDGLGGGAEWLGSAVWPAMAAYAWVAYALAVAVTYSRLYLEMHTIPQVQHPTYRFFA